MPLAIGTHLGPYEIVAPLGAGGMGEVYRARDTRLKREVAIKVLPETFSQDLDRVARFQREAELLATLNHPNIAAVYGLEHADGRDAIVLELVEGPTLAEMLAAVGRTLSGPPPGAGPKRSGLQVSEALPIARQIAEALEAAHEAGVIHRDLKPANIKVRPDGTVKVLDFGLAKLAESGADLMRSAGGAGPEGPAYTSQSPTLTSPAMMTGVGVILGTAAYMSPEQAKGRSADKRSDVWAFGCVLYEMLTGARAFDGDDMTDVLGAVVRLDPDWSRLPAETPPAIRELLQRCLTKDRRQRIGDIAAALFVLQAPALGTSSSTATGARVAARPRLWRHLAVHAGTLVLGSILTGAVVWLATRPATPRVTRLQITPPAEAALSLDSANRNLAITPDGSRLVYVGANGTTLFVRALDALEPTAIFTGSPRGVFVSPNGQWVGFSENSTLKKVALTGGPPVTLAQMDGALRGATWAPDDTIVFATAVQTGLQRVAAAGGTPTVLTRPDAARGEARHLWPEILPGGRAVLFTIDPLAGDDDTRQVAVLDLQNGTRKVLVRGGTHALFVAGGHLVYGAAGMLRAVAFDPMRLETQGASVPVESQVAIVGPGAVNAVAGGDGTLAFVSGSGAAEPRTLVWVDRQSRETPILAPPRPYQYPRIAPDGSRVALWEDNDVWVWDLARTTLTRVTFGSALENHSVWTPDGRRLIFSSERTGTRNLYVQAADGTGAVERLTESPNPQNVTAISPDGTRLIFNETTSTTGDDVMQLSMDGAHRVTTLVHTPSTERNGVVSPDGRWLAYEANDSGPLEIYVRPYPAVQSGHWQVSTGGGTRPLWAPNSAELFYVAPSGAIMRVGVTRGENWTATSPTLLFKEGYLTGQPGFVGRTYDIAPGGERFLLIKRAESAAAPNIVVVQHFDEELKRLVPGK